MPRKTINLRLDGLDAELADEIRQIAAARPRRPLQYAELRDLVSAAGAMFAAQGGARPATAEQIGLLPRQVNVPGTDIVLHSPTIAAQIRIRHAADHWAAERDPAWLDWHTYYCLAHAYDADALRAVSTLDGANSTIKAWALGLTCGAADLDAALTRLLADMAPPSDGSDSSGPSDATDTDAEKKTTGPVDWAEVLRFLVTEAGGTTTFWLYEVPESHVMWILGAITAVKRREADAASRAGGECVAPDPNSPLIVATANYCAVRDRLQGRQASRL